MLSAESASGKYPFASVEMMSKIIARTEKDPSCVRKLEDDSQEPLQMMTDAKCQAAKNFAQYSTADCIALFSDSFETASRCSRLRPNCPVLLFTSSETVARHAGMLNGIYATVIKKEYDYKKLCSIASEFALSQKFTTQGGSIVVLNDFEESSVSCFRV